MLQEQARNCYRNLSQEEKDIKREYGRNSYKNKIKEGKIKIKRIWKKLS